jgi:hypothetical protein
MIIIKRVNWLAHGDAVFISHRGSYSRSSEAFLKTLGPWRRGGSWTLRGFRRAEGETIART